MSLRLYNRKVGLITEVICQLANVSSLASFNDHRQPFPHAPDIPGTKACHEQIVFCTSQVQKTFHVFMRTLTNCLLNVDRFVIFTPQVYFWIYWFVVFWDYKGIRENVLSLLRKSIIQEYTAPTLPCYPFFTRVQEMLCTLD